MTALLSVLGADPDFSELEDDGDTVEHLGRVYRLRVEPDEYMRPGDDGDWYGAIAPADDRVNDYGYAPDRPAGFDGNAEKLRYDRGYEVWWQPPADAVRGTELFAKLRAALLLILEFGYYAVGLEELAGADAYGRPIVRRVAWIGGVEPMEYPEWQEMVRRDILPDLFAELH